MPRFVFVVLILIEFWLFLFGVAAPLVMNHGDGVLMWLFFGVVLPVLLVASFFLMKKEFQHVEKVRKSVGSGSSGGSVGM